MKRCVTCGQTLALIEFNRKRSAADGRQNVCRACNRARARRYYRENRDKHLRVIVERTALAKRIARELAGEHLLSHPCVDCGEDDIRVLDFDHRPGSGKTRNVMFLVNNGYSLARIQTEIEKCDVRCRNCHARVTYERDARDWRTALIRRRRSAETE
jgi:protein-arginine kinase activator protein McsA